MLRRLLKLLRSSPLLPLRPPPPSTPRPRLPGQHCWAAAVVMVVEAAA